MEKKKKKSSPDQYPEGPSKKLQDEKPDKINPKPDDPYEETGPPIKEIPITGGSHHLIHPHQEEILD